MILNLNGYINEEMVEKVVEFFNKAEDEEKTIFLQSEGGMTGCGLAILRIINRPDVTLIGYNDLSSMAFELFFKATECKRELLQGCVGMYHLTGIDTFMDSRWKPKGIANAVKQMFMEYEHKNDIKFCLDMNFSDDEIKSIKNGEDVYFLPDRMLELWKKT